MRLPVCIRNFKLDGDATRACCSRSHGYQIAFKPRGRTYAFASEAFFSGPFLPFSIVLGAASPGEASSNGEDYIAAIIEPSALPGHSSGLPSCCTFRIGVGPSFNSSLVLSSPRFQGRITLCYILTVPPSPPPLCSSISPPVCHKEKRSLFSRRVAEISPLPD